MAYDDWAEQVIVQKVAEGPYQRMSREVAAIFLLATHWQETFSDIPWYMVTGQGLLKSEHIGAIFDMLFPDSSRRDEPTEEGVQT